MCDRANTRHTKQRHTLTHSHNHPDRFAAIAVCVCGLTIRSTAVARHSCLCVCMRDKRTAAMLSEVRKNSAPVQSINTSRGVLQYTQTLPHQIVRSITNGTNAKHVYISPQAKFILGLLGRTVCELSGISQGGAVAKKISKSIRCWVGVCSVCLTIRSALSVNIRSGDPCSTIPKLTHLCTWAQTSGCPTECFGRSLVRGCSAV